MCRQTSKKDSQCQVLTSNVKHLMQDVQYLTEWMPHVICWRQRYFHPIYHLDFLHFWLSLKIDNIHIIPRPPKWKLYHLDGWCKEVRKPVYFRWREGLQLKWRLDYWFYVLFHFDVKRTGPISANERGTVHIYDKTFVFKNKNIVK